MGKYVLDGTCHPSSSNSSDSVTGPVQDSEVQTTLVPRSPTVPLERLAALEAKVARAVTQSRAASTMRAYRSDWTDFSLWCGGLGLDALPAAPATIAAYIAELADPGDDRSPAAVATITRRLAAIGEAHKLAGHVSPCGEALVRETMKGIRRTLGIAQRQKKPVTTADIRAAVPRLPLTVQGDRDRVVLLLGFASGMRRSELAGLDVEDLEAVPDGLLVHLGRSKTDQEGRGRRVEIVYGTDTATCPVTAVRTWLTRSGFTTGALLRPVDRHGRVLPHRLTGQGVALVVKRHMSALGHPTGDFAGHSLRRGLATTAARNGASERTIMRTTGHTSVETVRSYIDDAELFTDPASKYLGL